MLAIYRKEIASFLSSLIGYMAITVFLLITGLFLWVFPETNVLDYGFASLEELFIIAPWVYLLLVPAITMRSFSEEKKTGTIELLFTKPLSNYQIIYGKFFAGLTLVLFSLIPTLVYYFSIVFLGIEVGNIDTGAVIGSYIGLLFLGAAFVAIGLFTSSITENQIVSFIISIFLCFFCYFGFGAISELQLFGKLDVFVQNLGIEYHYNSMSRGVIDTRDVVYFVSLVTFFLMVNRFVLDSRKW
jgi:ABC-2 type transport system permease protein